jgi:uncharacterized protein
MLKPILMKTVCIVGASGMIGTELSAALKSKGYQVLETSVRADPRKNPDPSMESKISESDVVVNLAGANIFKERWTNLYKAEIYDSRIEGTKQIVAALKKAKEKYPTRGQVLINASAIGYYGSCGEALLDETSSPGHDFLAFVVKDWEEEATKAERVHGLRTAIFRFGVVLSKTGGALKAMLPVFKMGLGGPINLGNQWFSWIHVEDLVNILIFAIENPINGVYNATSPSCVRNKEYAHALGKVLHRPAVLPVPALGLRLLFGEVSEVMSASQRVNPEKILDAGFQIKHPHLEGALKSILLS